jgi:hypothetical protein
MKKVYLFLVMMMVCFSVVKAQTNIYFNNFDTLTAGGYTALQLGSPWTTWSSAPGGAEDAHISTTQSFSSPNSIGVALNNDLIFGFGDLITGRYKVTFQMYVATGYLGYYNFLSDFAAANSKWAFQVMIYNDSIFVDAGGTTAAATTFTFDAWNKMDLIIDLDDDFATFLINDAEIISYQWSKGAQGTDNSLKLDAIDFYGWDGTGAPTTATGTAGYFIDDINVDQVDAPEAPFNLDANLNGADIDVSWSAPTTTPDLYKLSRNGSIIYTGTNLNYTDVGPWPNNYGFGARAYYTGLGYSHSSNIDSVLVPGGVTRNLVLFEEGTGTWCQYCPGAAMGIRDLIETNQKAVAAIAYHSGDTYENAAALARISYYNITGFPTVFVDGTQSIVGGNATVSMYPSYLPLYNERIISPSFHILNVNVVQTAVDTYTATIDVEETYKAFASNWILHTALTESNIAEVWGNQTEVDFACRGMFPDEYGTDLDFSATTTQTATINFSTAGYVKDNCEFVVFVQHAPTGEVTQCAKVQMSTIVGVEELQGKEISVYPNPAQEYIILNSSGNGMMEIMDMTGKIVYKSDVLKASQLVDIRNFEKGIYMVKYSSEENVLTKKIVIQ